jgi:integrase
MARPQLELGTWGVVSRFRVESGGWAAEVSYRDADGRTRRVQRRGATGAEAERRLRHALSARSRGDGASALTADTRLKDAASLWFQSISEEGRAPTTLDAYSDTLRLHVLPALGELRLREITVGVCDRFIQSVKSRRGVGAARHARIVLSGTMGLAARRDAIRTNPVRDVSRLTSNTKQPRALTLDEVIWLRQALATDPTAVRRDLPAVVDTMLGTGLRIGEIMAVTWDALDLDAAQLEIRGTVVKIKRQPAYIQWRTKTKAGYRTVHLPAWLVSELRARPVVENEWGVVFPSPLGHLRDRSNTNRHLRQFLDPHGYDWVTTHTLRKTTATLLDEGGLTVREIADQLGHSRVSITQDTYFGRRIGSPRAAAALEIIAGARVTRGDENSE